MKLNYLKIAGKFPKMAMGIGIFVLSTGFFLLWWMIHPHSKHATTSTAASSKPAKRQVRSFKLEDVVLAGNTLVDFRTGEILARDWLEGFGDRIPQIVKVLPDERLVLVNGDRGLVAAYDFDGNAKPLLILDGKPVGSAAFSDGGRDVVFVREGNLWRGKVDWQASKVDSSQRVTDTGYYREEMFCSPWVWAGDLLFLTALGRVERVNLVDGKVTSEKSNLAEVIRGISPDHSLVLLPAGLKGLAVVDPASGEIFPQTTGERVNRILWLNSTKAVVQVGQNELGLYDHSAKKLTGIFKSHDPIRILAGASPDGESFIVGTAKAAGFFDLAANKLQLFAMPADRLERLSAGTLLVSSPAIDTAQRGMWLVHRDGKAERVLNQPADAMQGRGQESDPISKKGLFVSGGDLWKCDRATEAVSKVSHTLKIPPFLKDMEKN